MYVNEPLNPLIINELKKIKKKIKKNVERIEKSIIFAALINQNCSYMETIKSSNTDIDVAAKQLWQQIVNFQNLLFDNIHDDVSAHLYCDFFRQSSELARYIDRHFYND